MGSRSKYAGDHNDSSAERTRTLVREINNLLIDLERRHEQSIANTCPLCATAGRVDVEAFRWNGERHLKSVCQACGHTWMTPERRDTHRG
jgi:predicted Zn finger-like uncharacterized protein